MQSMIQAVRPSKMKMLGPVTHMSTGRFYATLQILNFKYTDQKHRW